MGAGPQLARACADACDMALVDDEKFDALGDVIVEGVHVFGSRQGLSRVVDKVQPGWRGEKLGPRARHALALAALSGMLLSAALAVGMDLQDPAGEAQNLLGPGEGLEGLRVDASFHQELSPLLGAACEPCQSYEILGMLEALSDPLSDFCAGGLTQALCESGEKRGVFLVNHATFALGSQGPDPLRVFALALQARAAAREARALRQLLPHAQGLGPQRI